MGTLSIVLGIIGVFSCWIPTVGWLSAVLGLLGIAFGIPSITHLHHRPGYAPWGISGLIIGVSAADLGFAYQLKYLGGSPPAFVLNVGFVEAVISFVVGAAVTAFGLYLARTKRPGAGIATASIALAALVLIGTSALVTADRQYQSRLEAVSSNL